MNAARQACRPKHQVLVLKCYPKFQKNNVEVKANSSELSYLLYYASSRRSKLQKVGDFLDKRATTDVWKARIGNVQVTLQILKALIEKCPRDLPLFAGAVLRILRTVLKSNDVTMVEESVPTFEAFCAHQDPANLAADQDYIKQYEEIVQLYAQFASKELAPPTKNSISWPVKIRFRKAGLRAMRAVASSESLGSETGRQLAVVIPVILFNIFSQTGDYLRRLENRDLERSEQDKEQALRRRQSISTVRTEEREDGDPIAASGTTEDADKLAEEEVGIIALRALRNIFEGVNRGQLRLATSAVLKFIGSYVKPDTQTIAPSKRGESWPTTLLEMICAWAPVQDRYAILVGAMETLVRSPIVEDDMGKQLVLATVIDYLLSSPINFIGLSVMDVLIGLISHTLLILQLGGSGTTILPHHQQTTSLASPSEKDLEDPKASGNISGDVVVELVKEPSPFRIQLLATLQNSMSSLAIHIYYTDQISDMVSAILKRLKPSPSSELSNTASAIQDPAGAVDAVASSASLKEKAPHTDKFFSFETARLTALETVKEVLLKANSRRRDGSSSSVPRSTVAVRAWEGTQWLLRDPSPQVRKAYADALITWLDLEMKKDDLRVVDDHRKREKENDRGGLARRAVSNASNRERSPMKKGRNTFLALLHLAIYEDAHQKHSEPELLVLHLLLTTLVTKLGVNGLRSGLPMIFRLQEDISTTQDPVAKIRIGSLVHGYFWVLSRVFDFEASPVGRVIHSEISRRKEKGLWIKSITIPPVPLERIDLSNSSPIQLLAQTVQTESLKPFDNKEGLVDRIADGYSDSLYSPPTSPPGSPGRSISMPIITPVTLKLAPQLAPKVKEDLLADWTKDICIAMNSKDASSSASVTGSRTAASANQKNNYLGITIPNGNLDSVNNSPLHTPRRASSRPPSIAYGLMGRLHSPHRNRSPSSTPGSRSSLHSAVRVDDLKRVLSSSAPRTSYSMRPSTQRRREEFDKEVQSSPSDSMVSGDFSISDASFVTAEHPRPGSSHNASLHSPATPQPPESPSTPAATLTPRPGTSSSQRPPSPHSPTSNAQREREHALLNDGVPPVPPIPASLRDKSASPPIGSRPKTAPSNGNSNGNGSIAVRKSRSGSTSTGKIKHPAKSEMDSAESGRSGRGRKKAPSFLGFLDEIVVSDDEGDRSGGGRPPY